MNSNQPRQWITLTGRCSWFGGPNDSGVESDEGLALYESVDNAPPGLFLAHQPPGTTGLARRLNPDARYCACRWDYHKTPVTFLRKSLVIIRNIRSSYSTMARPCDWGPNEKTGRIADLSPGILKILHLNTDDEIEVKIPLPDPGV